MPRLPNDDMIELSQDDVALIKTLGYQRCADAVGLTRGYIRSLCSNGPKAQPKKLKYTDLQTIRNLPL